MAQNTLTFVEGKSYTVDQFKSLQKVDRILVKKSAKQGILLFTFGQDHGWISKKGIPAHPMISRVIGDQGEFWLMHEEGNGGATVIAEL